MPKLTSKSKAKGYQRIFVWVETQGQLEDQREEAKTTMVNHVQTLANFHAALNVHDPLWEELLPRLVNLAKRRKETMASLVDGLSKL